MFVCTQLLVIPALVSAINKSLTKEKVNILLHVFFFSHKNIHLHYSTIPESLQFYFAPYITSMYVLTARMTFRLLSVRSTYSHQVLFDFFCLRYKHSEHFRIHNISDCFCVRERLGISRSIAHAGLLYKFLPIYFCVVP